MKKYCRKCGKKLGFFRVHVDGYSEFCYDCGESKIHEDKVLAEAKAWRKSLQKQIRVSDLVSLRTQKLHVAP